MNETELARTAARVSRQFRSEGIDIVVVGGSALSLHAPSVYMSEDIDIAVGRANVTRFDVEKILGSIGFASKGRYFVHPDSQYAVDFVAHTPSIDQREITSFATVQTPEGPVRTYYFEDVVADRLSQYIHWNERQSLTVILEAIAQNRQNVDLRRLATAIEAFDAPDKITRDRIAIAQVEIERVLGTQLQSSHD